jgi:hypothetical protein
MTVDARLGNTPRRYLGEPPAGINMRLPPEIHHSVVFLGYRNSSLGMDELILNGTGSVMSVGDIGEPLHFYLVTARHVARALVGKRAVVRANNADGTAEEIALDDKWWFYPGNEHFTDVAVRPFDIRELDVSPIPLSMFLDDETICDRYIGPGDEVSITGLFTHISGESRNLPIVRRGSVAMIPQEKIPGVNLGDCVRDIDGYLIEIRSVGGLSGSPAFVRAPIGVDYDVHTRSGKWRVAKVHFQGDYFLLGICQGHWEIPPSGKKN